MCAPMLELFMVVLLATCLHFLLWGYGSSHPLLPHLSPAYTVWFPLCEILHLIPYTGWVLKGNNRILGKE
jgi:hypothetical protein